MASHQPIPSRAALNALRGAILTTSCSVVLLAEERRRRLQIARAAIDNARKLHSVQNNRGPVALAESHGLWDGQCAAAIDDHVLSMASVPRPRTSTRRRRRTQLIGTDLDKESCPHDHRLTQVISRAEGHNEPDKESRASHNLANGLDMLNFDMLKTTSWRLSRPQNFRSKIPRSVSRSLLSNHAVYTAALDTNSIDNEVDVALGGPNEDETIADDGSTKHIHSREAAQDYLQKTGHGNPVSRSYYGDVIPLLERLLEDLEIPNIDKNLQVEIASLVRSVFDRLASFGPLPQEIAKQVPAQAVRLLRIISQDCPEEITTTLSSVLPLSKDAMEFLVPLTAILQNSLHRKFLGQVLFFLYHDAASSPGERAKLVHGLVFRHAILQGNFAPTKQLYLAFQEFGLFSQMVLPQDMEYKIRRLIVVLALEAEDHDFANAELPKLEGVKPGASMHDMRLQKLLIARQASNGNWDEVLSQICMLRQRVNPQRADFQRLLAKVTDIVAQNRDKDELEAFLRKAVIDFSLKLKSRWVYAVLDVYASRRQADLAISWLQFCGNSGLPMDTPFHQGFLERCRKYWCFSEKAVRHLANRLPGKPGQAKRVARDKTFGDKLDHNAMTTRTLGQAVLEQLKSATPDMQHARGLIRSAQEEACDVSKALTPLLMGQLERGDDPRRLIKGALQLGVRLHDMTYNKAAQALSAGGSHKAAANMCQIAARENGKGQLLYNEYNFANLVFAYTGSADYKALQSVLSSFTSDRQWWHGSRTCKESIKLAMKTAAVRAVAHSRDSERHRRALEQLDSALLHVKRCRATDEERRAVAEAYVRLARALKPKSHGKLKNRCGDGGVRDMCRHHGQDAADQPVLAVASGSA